MYVHTLYIHTRRWLVASYGSNADVSQISHIQRPIRRHNQRGRTIKPGIFGIAISGLIAVAVCIILQDSQTRDNKQHQHKKFSSHICVSQVPSHPHYCSVMSSESKPLEFYEDISHPIREASSVLQIKRWSVPGI